MACLPWRPALRRGAKESQSGSAAGASFLGFIYLELLTKFNGIETGMGADKRRFEENKGIKAFFIGVHQRLSLFRRFLLDAFKSPVKKDGVFCGAFLNNSPTLKKGGQGGFSLSMVFSTPKSPSIGQIEMIDPFFKGGRWGWPLGQYALEAG